MNYLLPDGVYKTLKWAALIALPAIGVFIQTIGPSVGLDPSVTTSTVTVLDALGVLVGVLIGASAATAKPPEGDGTPED